MCNVKELFDSLIICTIIFKNSKETGYLRNADLF